MSPSTRRKSLPYDLGSERLRAAVAIVAVGSIVPSVQAQISADQVSQIRSANQARVEALTIWGSDYGFSDGIFDTRGGLQQSPSAEVHSELVKLGGSGEIGDPQPVAGAPIGWQPRLQGNMGYLESETNLQPEPLKGDRSRVTTYGIEFGGGVRFWMSQAFSVAPTLMGIYGSTSEDYTDRSAFAQMHLAQLVGLGLIDWHVDTWTLRPALNLQYLILIDRTIITLSTDSTSSIPRASAAPTPNFTLKVTRSPSPPPSMWMSRSGSRPRATSCAPAASSAIRRWGVVCERG